MGVFLTSITVILKLAIFAFVFFGTRFFALIDRLSDFFIFSLSCKKFKLVIGNTSSLIIGWIASSFANKFIEFNSVKKSKCKPYFPCHF